MCAMHLRCLQGQKMWCCMCCQQAGCRLQPAGTCAHADLQVFVTVGSETKRAFLLETFPQLQADHIGDSRSDSFESLIMNVTKGKGVHLLLNSLSDDKLQVSSVWLPAHLGI